MLVAIIIAISILLIGCGSELEWPENCPECTLYWVSYRGGPPNIWAIDVPGGEPVQVTFFEEGCGRWGIDFAPDGRMFFGAKDNGQWELFRLDIGGGTPVMLTDSPQYDGDPAVSPDGERVCFMTKRWGFTYYDRELATIPCGGGEVIRMTDWQGSDDSPRWSSDGESIAFVKVNSQGRFVVMTLDSDNPGSFQAWTPETEDAYSPVWTPDGGAIVCVITVNGVRDIWKIEIPGGATTNLTNTTFSDEKPAISPDGSRVAHQVYHDGQWDIAITDIDGSSSFFLTNNSTEDISACWSPDGSWLFWVSLRDGDREIYGCPVGSSSEPFRITDFPGDDIRVMCR